MVTRLEQLYARRLKIDQERAQINKLIAKLERRGTYIAIAKIHHATEGCSYPVVSRAYVKKVTKNWKNVDCMKCLQHQQRQTRRARRKHPAVPWTEPRRSP